MMIDLLHKMFPNAGMVAFSLAWVAIAMVASLLFNGQDMANKRNNAWKSFLLLSFAGSWATLAGYVANGRWNIALTVFLGICWVLYLTGDWIALGIHTLVHSPGGGQGVVWFAVAKHSKAMQEKATTRAIASLRPTELKLYQAELAEKNAAMLAALVDTVPGAKVIVAPPPITSAFPHIKQLVVTPTYLVSVVPEALVVTVKPSEPDGSAPIDALVS